MAAFEEDHPRAKIHPPLVMLVALILGFTLRVAYGGLLPIPSIAGEFLGLVFVVGAVVILQMCIRIFGEFGEELRPTTPSRQLFTNGVYSHSRNPIYVAMMLLGTGLGFATLNLWMVFMTLLAGTAIPGHNIRLRLIVCSLLWGCNRQAALKLRIFL